jgi:hypothetical protein
MAVTVDKLAYLIELQAKGGPEAQRLMRDLEYAAKSASSKMAMYSQRSSDEQQTHATKLADARIRLGVHSEKSVQREIYHTMRAYVELKKSGTSSAADIANAHKAMTERIAALNRQIGISTQTSTERQKGYLDQLAAKFDATGKKAAFFNKSLDVTKSAGGAVIKGTLGAAGAVVVGNAAIQKPVAYDTALRKAAVVSFAADRDEAGIKAGVKELDTLINETVRNVGGSRDALLQGFSDLVGTGKFTLEEQKTLLPALQKQSIAGDVDFKELVVAAVAVKTSLNVAVKDLPLALSKIQRAGVEGSFEIKDSAHWVGTLAPQMKQAGYTGMDGLEKLLTHLQLSTATAGSKNQGANNLQNFYAKMNSEGTIKEFKKQGIDLVKEKANGIIRGVDPIETYMAQLQKVMAKQDPTGNAQKMVNRASALKDPEERSKAFEGIKALYEQKGLGQIIGDLQEMSGYMALISDPEYAKKVLGNIKTETGSTTEKSYNVMNDGVGSKMTRAGNEKDIAMSNSLNVIDGPLKGVLEGATGLAQTFPNLTTVATLATGAIAMLGAAAGAAALPQAFDMLRRKGKGSPLGADDIAGAKPSASPAGAGKVVGGLLKSTAVVGALVGTAQAASIILDSQNKDKGRDLTRIGVTTGTGILGGAAAGALAGSVVPGVGTVLGGLIGGGVGAWGGGAAFDAAWKPKSSLLNTPAYHQLSNLPSVQSGAGSSGPLSGTSWQTELKAPQKLALGDGKITIDLRVPEGYSASTTVLSMPNIKLDGGSTSPWARN